MSDQAAFFAKMSPTWENHAILIFSPVYLFFEHPLLTYLRQKLGRPGPPLPHSTYGPDIEW